MLKKINPLNDEIGLSNSYQYIFLMLGGLAYMIFNIIEIFLKL